MTTSSDTTVRLFDLATSNPVVTFSSHSDYVKAASFVPSLPQLVVSGAYDNTVRLWDQRVGRRSVWVGSHGRPVDSVLVGEQGTMAVTAGGPIMRVWDLLGASTSRSRGQNDVVREFDRSAADVDDGDDQDDMAIEQETTRERQDDDDEEEEEEEDGQEDDEDEIDTGTQYCLKALSNHQKAITSLCWAESENGEKRVLSGGLDGLVKVYDPQDNWRVRHTMRYGGQVMSLAVSVRDFSLSLSLFGMSILFS